MCVRIGGKSKREEHTMVTVAFIWPGSGRLPEASSQGYISNREPGRLKRLERGAELAIKSVI